MIGRLVAGAALLLALACGAAGSEEAAPAHQAVAVFAGGCFWCMEPAFDKVPGVVSTTSGYTGGTQEDATYERVSSGRTEHFEAVQVAYDPAKVTYEHLLDVFWHNIDPLDATGQFCDKGRQYRSAIFVQSDAEQQAAERSKQALQRSGRLSGTVATEIRRASPFYPAEEYHQDYYLKNPLKYRFYRAACGRDRRLEAVWGQATN